MLSGLMNLLRACFRPKADRYVHKGSDASGRQDGLLWYKDTGHHSNGEYSMAVVQANNLLEDQSQLESGCLSSHDSGPYGTFVGIYDGHGGPETSRFINEHLFRHLKSFTSEHQSMSVEVIRKAFQATEDGFFSLVSRQWSTKPQIAAVGSCCLVGVICGGTLYIANLGDSRAVLGRLVKSTEEVVSIRLSAEHNASIESVRQELHSLHPDDSQIVVLKHNVWRVKGLIQISRSIALQEAAKKREMRYSDLKKIDRGVRRHFHDDITVIVVFLDSHLVSRASTIRSPNVSVKGGGINLPHNTLAPEAGGNHLIGVFPDELILLRNLSSLSLNGNKLSGPIPVSIGNLKQLAVFNLRELPSDLLGLPNLKVIALQENMFLGVVPEELGNCLALEVIDLCSSSLSGQVPVFLSYVSHLSVLDLGLNNLTGRIPYELSN
ncbi:unnamed protein product [Fraxinus pennsylvanica]|uniref:protein-serine/threonine phosphatase n=1 Tax=Fraxinus pennsylvanica TaxID=56036 RepID=A0AAD2EC06_9LAMI|nr:unnamed protein product [Fraxinus pennsylvanica]